MQLPMLHLEMDEAGNLHLASVLPSAEERALIEQHMRTGTLNEAEDWLDWLGRQRHEATGRKESGRRGAGMRSAVA